MHGKSLFLHRAVSRTDQWGPQFPPSPWHAVNPTLLGGRQLAVAVTDARGLRCAVFTSFGAILEFRASWDELERAGTWWHYARAWHFWFVDDLQSARRVFLPIPARSSLHPPNQATHPTRPPTRSCPLFALPNYGPHAINSDE
jgi:hypothetical protein